jgi:hypothetical protein
MLMQEVYYKLPFLKVSLIVLQQLFCKISDNKGSQMYGAWH